jgi:hypothetical protein
LLTSYHKKDLEKNTLFCQHPSFAKIKYLY